MIPWLRIAPYIGAIVAVLALLSYTHHKGVVSGRADIQAKFDQFVDAQEALTIQAQKEADAQEAAAKKANDAILTDYQARLGTSAAYSRDLAARLRDALAHSGGGPVPEGADQPGTAGTAPTPSATGIGEAIGDAIAECRDNESQLSALLAQLTPQL